VRNLGKAEFRKQFRFTQPQLEEVLVALEIPARIRTGNRDNVDSMTALCMTLYRLSGSSRLDRMEFTFRRSSSFISRVVNHLIKWVMLRWDQLLIWDHHRLTPAKLEMYQKACSDQSGYAANSVFGFIDGTVRKICRPVIHQRSMYNGHKHIHALKYQAVV
ncbi:MAG: hypothetical protein J3R72DRAFT_355316, partial [Linnemannia gamsii]